ncbi:17620_t:CDS:2, partial [Cetraspora pellucida]
MVKKQLTRIPNGNLKDWKTLYKDILDFFQIQYNPVSECTPVEFIKSDLVIDLSKVFPNLENREYIKTDIVRIYGDVVQLSENLEIRDLDECNILFIVARRIEVNPGCRIVINHEKKDTFRLVVYAKEIPFDLNVEITSIYNNKVIINKFSSNHEYKHIGGTLLVQSGNLKDIKHFEKFDNKIFLRKQFSKILQFSLQIACALFYDEPTITQSILNWIIEITAQSQLDEIKELYHHGLAISELFHIFKKRMETKRQIRFVPLLDKRMYLQSIKGFIDAAKSYEDKYMELLKNIKTNEMKKCKLELLLKDCEKTTEMFQDFKSEDNKLYESTFEVMKKVESSLRERKNEVDNARTAFEKGFDKWGKKIVRDAKTQIIIDIVQILLNIGMLVSQPSCINSIVEIIKSVSNSIHVIFNTANDDVQKINEIFNRDDIVRIKDINKKVKDIIGAKDDLKSNRDVVNDYRANTMNESRKIESMETNELAK